MGQPMRSHGRTVGGFHFCILAFPRGSLSIEGKHVIVFLEVQPGHDWDPGWRIQEVKYSLSCMNLKDYKFSVTKHDACTFHAGCLDRGWHDMVPTAQLTPEFGWLDSEGTLTCRARIWRIGEQRYAYSALETLNDERRAREI